jgi:hypothetical protein
MIQDWFGFLVKAGTPNEIVVRLNEAINRALMKPRVGEAIEKIAAEPTSGTPAEFGQFLNAQLDHWSRVVKESGQSRDFRVTLLGTGVPTPRPDRFGPSTLVEAGDQKLLIEAGRGATIRLYQIGVPIGGIDALLLTHYHSDHTSGIPDVWLTGRLQ